jgi:serine protease Do
MMPRRGFALLIALFSVLFANQAQAASKPSRAATPAPSPLAAMSRQFRDLVDRVSPAVVQIAAVAVAPVAGRAATGEGFVGVEQRGGSGVIVSSDGYIVTNAHVVESARRLDVILARPAAADQPGRSIVHPVRQRVEATVIGVDRETDLAVLKVEEAGLPALSFGDSDLLGEGDLVLAFGSPLGLDNSVSMGVVSAVGRQLRPDDRMVYIQTDTSINPGNSGGPLVNMDGRVVGINTLIYSQSGGNEGIGFSAPSNIVESVYKQIRSTGHVRRGSIGVSAQTITPSLAEGLGLSRKWGVILSDVHPASPAAEAGLEAGDIVTALDGKTMENGRQFDINLYRRAVGDSATVTVLRGTEQLTLRVPVIAREDDPTRIIDLIKSERSLVAPIGALVVEVNDAVAPVLPWLRQPRGILVVAWSADAPRVISGVEPGDVILAVNRKPVGTIEVLNAELSRVPAGRAVVLEVNRMGSYRYVAMPPE